MSAPARLSRRATLILPAIAAGGAKAAMGALPDPGPGRIWINVDRVAWQQLVSASSALKKPTGK